MFTEFVSVPFIPKLRTSSEHTDPRVRKGEEVLL